MKNNVLVSTIMTKNVITICLKDDLMKAERLFKLHKIRHIPVVKGNKVVGILSYTDLLRISFADAFDEKSDIIDTAIYKLFKVEHVMAKKVVTISPETTIKETAEILSTKEFHALPVCLGDLLVGIVTTTDLIRYLINQYKYKIKMPQKKNEAF